MWQLFIIALYLKSSGGSDGTSGLGTGFMPTHIIMEWSSSVIGDPRRKEPIPLYSGESIAPSPGPFGGPRSSVRSFNTENAARVASVGAGISILGGLSKTRGGSCNVTTWTPGRISPKETASGLLRTVQPDFFSANSISDSSIFDSKSGTDTRNAVIGWLATSANLAALTSPSPSRPPIAIRLGCMDRCNCMFLDRCLSVSLFTSATRSLALSRAKSQWCSLIMPVTMMMTVHTNPTKRLSAKTTLDLSNHQEAASSDSQGSFPVWLAISLIAAATIVATGGIILMVLAIRAKNRR